MSEHIMDVPMLVPIRFNTEQLGMLSRSLPYNLLRWAEGHPDIRSEYAVHDMAMLYAQGRIMQAREGADEFRHADRFGIPFSEINPAFEVRSPLECAGSAAGHVAVARMLAEWYDLTPEDFARVTVPANDPHAFADRTMETLEHAVGFIPNELGIAPYTPRDVYAYAHQAAVEAIDADGPSALDPFLTFPSYPV